MTDNIKCPYGLFHPMIGARTCDKRGDCSSSETCKAINAENHERHLTEIENNINAPAHYRQGAIECIDAIESALTPEEFRGYLKGNVIKYTWRLGHKDDPAQEAGKMVWYGQRLQTTLIKWAKE
jgi:hypothetical protein